MDSSTPTPGLPANGAPPSHRAEQDQKMANEITAAQEMVAVLNNDAAVRVKLAPRGYDTQRIDVGRALAQAAQGAYQMRQSAMAAQVEKTGQVVRLFRAEQTLFADYRETGRTVFKDKASRTALGLSGRVPRDLQKFITFARAAYVTAKSAPYSAALAAFGYTAAAMDARLAALDGLVSADQEQVSAIGNARQATRQRNETFAPLREWISQLRRVSRRVFRTEPEQARKLDF